MKKNIFAVNLPANVNLPFATIKFMREPVKSDIRSIDDLPTAVLNFIDTNTAEIHPFYIQVVRKDVSALDYDDIRVSELIREGVHHAVVDFGNSNNDSMSLAPHYTHMHYEHKPDGSQNLRANAEEQFFNAVMNQARPIIQRQYFNRAIYDLSFGGKMNSFTLLLTDSLRMQVWSEDAKSRHSVMDDNPTVITGTAKLLGKPAKVRIECDYRHHTLDHNLSIRNWLSDEVLHAAIEDRLFDVIGESFGPLADGVIKHLLSDIEFNLN